METFIGRYDQQIKELKKNQIDLPKMVLAMQLLDSANLQYKEKQLVLTAIDYNDKELLYEQTKSALRKFFGNQTLFHEIKKPNPTKEEIFQSEAQEHNETFIARGRNSYRGRYPRHRGAWSDNQRQGFQEDIIYQPEKFQGKRFWKIFLL